METMNKERKQNKWKDVRSQLYYVEQQVQQNEVMNSNGMVNVAKSSTTSPINNMTLCLHGNPESVAKS